MKNKLKIIMATFMITTTLITNFTSATVNAASVTKTIDNDTNVSGYSNYNGNSAFSYITASYLYNGDARIASSSSSNNYYEWHYPSIFAEKTSCTCKVQAYLNHSNFTDTSASYYVGLAQTMAYRVGSINQNTAPSGWTSISRNFSSVPEGNFFSSTYASVHASGASGKYTGADGLKVTITY